jgi:molybdopterin-guanine dinucleotide biosynthesis protein B
VLVSSSQRFALMHELRGAPELTLPQALGRLSRDALVLVEGYKTFPIPKLEIWRATVGKPLLHPEDPDIRGVATDTPEAFAAASLPVFRLTDVDEIATFVLSEAAVLPFAIDAHKTAE